MSRRCFRRQRFSSSRACLPSRLLPLLLLHRVPRRRRSGRRDRPRHEFRLGRRRHVQSIALAAARHGLRPLALRASSHLVVHGHNRVTPRGRCLRSRLMRGRDRNHHRGSRSRRAAPFWAVVRAPLRWWPAAASLCAASHLPMRTAASPRPQSPITTPQEPREQQQQQQQRARPSIT